MAIKNIIISLAGVFNHSCFILLLYSSLRVKFFEDKKKIKGDMFSVKNAPYLILAYQVLDKDNSHLHTINFDRLNLRMGYCSSSITYLYC